MSQLLEYTPVRRTQPMEACAHNFFDELRELNTRLPNGRELPPLFNFTPSGATLFVIKFLSYVSDKSNDNGVFFLCRARSEAWIEHKTDSLTRVLDAPSTEQNQPRDCSGSGCRRCHQFWPGITTLSITCRVSVWRPRTHDLTDASGSSPNLHARAASVSAGAIPHRLRPITITSHFCARVLAG